jgi:hypothetical protein
MREASNAPWKLSTSICIPLPPPSWRSSGASVCPRAPRSVAFWPLCLPSPSKPCVACFSLMSLPPLWYQRNSQQDSGIAPRSSGTSSISMGRVRPPANALYLRAQSCLHLSVAYVRSALPAPLGVSEGKSSAPGPRSCRPIPESRLGSFGGSGNGKSREELRRAVAQIQHYLTAHQIPAAHARLAARRTVWHGSYPL